MNELKKYLGGTQYKIGEIEFLVGDRIIRPNLKDTDIRTSEIIKMAENYFVVSQDKIDCTLNIVDQILRLL